MGMTITEKILAKASGRDKTIPGENIWLNVDVLMTHDVCGPPTISIWQAEFGEKAKIWDKDKLVIFPDHYIRSEDAADAKIGNSLLQGLVKFKIRDKR